MLWKMVKLYSCGFCGKSGLSASHMSRHEKHCTANPDRICRMCALVGEKPINLKAAIVTLPKLTDFDGVEDEFGHVSYIGLEDAIKEPFAQIVKQAACPACTLAIIRQSGLPAMAFDFNYKKEREQFMHDNLTQREW